MDFRTKDTMFPIKIYIILSTPQSFGGIRYENERLSTEEFTKAKPDLPYGEVPVLRWGVETICQTMAISR